MKKKYWLTIILGVMAVLLTVSLLFIDRKAVGPNGSEVGFATLNSSVFEKVGTSKTWDKVTDITIAAVLASGVVFAIYGLIQWVKRKKFSKIDWEIRMLGVVYAVMAVLYVLFEKLLVVNYRPVLEDGALEASFPSTHTMIAVTVGLTVALTLGKYVKSKVTSRILTGVLVVLVVVIAAGRILAGMHWTTDVLGGLLYGATLVSLYANLKRRENE